MWHFGKFDVAAWKFFALMRGGGRDAGAFLGGGIGSLRS